LGKALARPDQVQKVLQHVRQEGLLSTWRKVKDRLSAPNPLGYACAGIVIETGADVRGFQKGDRVACAGAQAAFHAEVVSIPVNLAVLVPPEVDLAAASTATLGAIALQGVRQSDIRLGENVVVIGLGFLGQLTQQLVRASGGRVFGIDLDPRKVELAKSLGMDTGGVWGDTDLASAVLAFSGGLGADAVLLTASSASPDLVRLAGDLARDRARIVVVGDVPIDIPRSPFYEKELSIYFSRSYGPGRYDAVYEEQGIDYPAGYVRWTENRNMQSYIESLKKGMVNVVPLLTHRYAIDQAEDAYAKLANAGEDLMVGMLLNYPTHEPLQDLKTLSRQVRHPGVGDIGIAMIGAGHFGSSVLLPNLGKQSGLRFETVCTSHGHTAQAIADKYKFGRASCDPGDVFSNSSVQAVVIATQHDTHASLVLAALEAGKPVFVEKPLCLTPEELQKITETQRRTGLPIMVGFNRRFSSYTTQLQAELKSLAGPRMILYRINAGPLPADHWLKDKSRGGGRIRGELCHFLDYVTTLTPSRPHQVFAKSMSGADSEDISVQIDFADHSQAHIVYTAQGPSSLPKERLEVFCAQHAIVLDDFRNLTMHSPKGRKRKSSWSQDKGYEQEMAAWIKSLRTGGESPIPIADSVLSTHLTFLTLESLQSGNPVRVSSPQT